MSNSNLPKKASDHLPWCKDQGIDYLAATGKAAQGMQGAATTMPSGGVLTFAELGLSNMADTNYAVVVYNNSGASAGQVAEAARGLGGFTVTGPSPGDELAIVVVGKIAGQL